jgi:hypothetical protein
MSRLDEELCEWTEVVSSRLTHLSRSQARGLALYSFGVVMVQSCGVTSIAVFLGMLLGRNENSVRQQLRELTYAGPDKRGKQRKSLDVESCFGDLVGWIIAWWSNGAEQVALVLDATTFQDVLTILVVSVVYRGCAIPVAGRPHWEARLDILAPHVPPSWTVLVLADRGLYANWLFKCIVKHHWHPFLRINQQGTFRPCGQRLFQPLRHCVSAESPLWSGTATCFKTKPLVCTLLARFDPRYEDPWLIVTDVPPDVADSAWYGRRSWIESGFKDLKRGGWQWQHTRLTDPDRAARLWLVLAVATLWVVNVGAYAEAE